MNQTDRPKRSCLQMALILLSAVAVIILVIVGGLFLLDRFSKSDNGAYAPRTRFGVPKETADAMANDVATVAPSDGAGGVVFEAIATKAPLKIREVSEGELVGHIIPEGTEENFHITSHQPVYDYVIITNTNQVNVLNLIQVDVGATTKIYSITASADIGIDQNKEMQIVVSPPDEGGNVTVTVTLPPAEIYKNKINIDNTLSKGEKGQWFAPGMSDESRGQAEDIAKADTRQVVCSDDSRRQVNINTSASVERNVHKYYPDIKDSKEFQDQTVHVVVITPEWSC